MQTPFLNLKEENDLLSLPGSYSPVAGTAWHYFQFWDTVFTKPCRHLTTKSARLTPIDVVNYSNYSCATIPSLLVVCVGYPHTKISNISASKNSGIIRTNQRSYVWLYIMQDYSSRLKGMCNSDTLCITCIVAFSQ